jgi:CHASE3 domain sensor protein
MIYLWLFLNIVILIGISYSVYVSYVHHREWIKRNKELQDLNKRANQIANQILENEERKIQGLREY